MSTIDPNTIDPTHPQQGNAETAEVRANEQATKDNFTAAKNDIEAIEGDYFAKDGSRPMTVPFQAIDGTIAAPGFGFQDESQTGLRREAAGDARMTVLGVDVAFYTPDGQVVIGTGGSEARPLEEWFLENVRTVNIPTDYPTLQAAFDGEAHWAASQISSVIVNIETGHALTDGLRVIGGDWSNFTITAADATVLLAAGFPAESDVLYGEGSANFCHVPTLACLIDGEGTKGRHGVYYNESCTGIVAAGAGVQNIGGTGAGGDLGVGLFMVGGSNVRAEGCIFKGSKFRNLWASQNCILRAQNSDFSGALGDMNALLTRGTIFYVAGSDFKGATGRALEVHRSFGTISTTVVPSDFSNNGTGGLVITDGSVVAGAGSVINNSGGNAVNCTNKSALFLNSAAIATATENGIRCTACSSVDANATVISGATVRGVSVSNLSGVNITNGSVTGSTLDDLWISHGGQIEATGCTTSTAGATPNLADAVVKFWNMPAAAGDGIIWVYGYIVKTVGTATIAGGTTSIIVNHGLSAQPDPTGISWVARDTPTNDPGDIRVANFSPTQFTFVSRFDPGSNLRLAWTATTFI